MKKIDELADLIATYIATICFGDSKHQEKHHADVVPLAKAIEAAIDERLNQRVLVASWDLQLSDPKEVGHDNRS